MAPEVVRAGLRLSASILLLAVGSLPFLKPTSAEFWATAAAAAIALVFTGGMVFLLSILHQSPPRKG
jgi:hypothetical protein